MLENKKFDPQEFIQIYNFSPTDLQIWFELLFDMLDQDQPILIVPLLYSFGGRISCDYDRLLCSTYLKSFDQEDCERADLGP
jgi:hypothetical protein